MQHYHTSVGLGCLSVPCLYLSTCNHQILSFSTRKKILQQFEIYTTSLFFKIITLTSNLVLQNLSERIKAS